MYFFPNSVYTMGFSRVYNTLGRCTPPREAAHPLIFAAIYNTFASDHAFRRDDLLKDLSAPEGKTVRSLTDPNGVNPEDAIIGPIGTGRYDPVLGRYVAECTNRIRPNWRPLPQTISAHPDFEVRVMVLVAADGTLSKRRIIKSSGDTAFDRSAITAVSRTARFPPPPPSYVASAEKGVTITLAARDLL